jgi:putative intracellular protease/amidase
MAVLVFLHDTYADWELGYILSELVSPAALPGITKKRREVVTFGLSDAAVTSMGTLRVTPSTTIDRVDPDRAEALILPGGLFWSELADERLDALVGRLARRGAPVAAICAATGYLARLGLLDAVRHTSNSVSFLKERAPDYRGDDHYVAQPAVRDGGLVTASGLGAVEFTVEILRALDVYPPEVCDVWYRAFKHGEDPFAG